MKHSSATSTVASAYQGQPLKDGKLFLQEVVEEGLAPFFFHRLKSASNTLLPSSRLETLKRSFLASAARHLHLEQALMQILNQFEHERISCLVLKGMALAYLIYPDPATRTMGDIDLLIQPDQIRQATEALASLGYHPFSQYQEYEEELIRFGGELAFVKTGAPMVELHWALEQYERFKGLIRIDEEALWQRAISYSVNGIQARTLSLEDQLLTLSIHLGMVHRMKGLKWLLDIDRLIRTLGPHIDWPLLMQRAKAWGIRRLLCHILWMSKETFGTPLPPEVSIKPVWGSHTPFAQFVFLDRWQDRVPVLIRVVFPSGDWLRFRYHLKKGQRLFPYRVLHPFRLLCGKFS